jgi:hypothetical protein
MFRCPPDRVNSKVIFHAIWHNQPVTKQQVKDILDRVSSWPQERQEELAEIALEIEADMKGKYRATTEEVEAIDEGLQGEAASEEEVQAAFATFRRG